MKKRAPHKSIAEQGAPLLPVKPEGDNVTSKAVWRTPSVSELKRRRRPRGWSPLSDWVLVRTKTRCENLASINCREQDMETWCPRYVEPGKGVPVALFPGYLFVRPHDRYRALRNTRGVIDVVMMGGEPDYVPKAVMNELRKRADSDGIVTLPRQRKPRKGERVQIKVGAWQDCIGLYDGLDAKGRIKVLFEFMGRKVTLQFNRAASIEVVDL